MFRARARASVVRLISHGVVCRVSTRSLARTYFGKLRKLKYSFGRGQRAESAQETRNGFRQRGQNRALKSPSSFCAYYRIHFVNVALLLSEYCWRSCVLHFPPLFGPRRKWATHARFIVENHLYAANRSAKIRYASRFSRVH